MFEFDDRLFQVLFRHVDREPRLGGAAYHDFHGVSSEARDGAAVVGTCACGKGASALSLATMSGNRLRTHTTSSMVLSRDSEKRIAPRSADSGTFIARSTCD